MIRRLLEQRGEFSLAGSLVAMTLFAGVLVATLTVYDQFQAEAKIVTTRNDIQDRARTASDMIARALRNLASPTPEQPQAIDRAEAFDLIFKTVDSVGPNAGLNASNVRRVRYCLDQAGLLWMQVQTWITQTPPTAPPASACPGSGWGTTTRLADSLVNRTSGADRPVFTYDENDDLTDISQIGVQLLVDTSSSGPAATRLQTGVFLRNQNRKPTAMFTATTTAQGIVLNGSGSSDPEGETLDYVWYDGTTKVGTGVVFTYKVTAGTSHSIKLSVFDPAGLQGDSATQVVTG
jgi:hypothetical protein